MGFRVASQAFLDLQVGACLQSVGASPFIFNARATHTCMLQNMVLARARFVPFDRDILSGLRHGGSPASAHAMGASIRGCVRCLSAWVADENSMETFCLSFFFLLDMPAASRCMRHTAGWD